MQIESTTLISIFLRPGKIRIKKALEKVCDWQAADFLPIHSLIL
jgi:hypothetical protein